MTFCTVLFRSSQNLGGEGKLRLPAVCTMSSPLFSSPRTWRIVFMMSHSYEGRGASGLGIVLCVGPCPPSLPSSQRGGAWLWDRTHHLCGFSVVVPMVALSCLLRRGVVPSARVDTSTCTYVRGPSTTTSGQRGQPQIY